MINQKKAKALRRFIRITGLDPKHVLYQWVAWERRDGNHIPINRILHPESGRAVYRRLKPLWA